MKALGKMRTLGIKIGRKVLVLAHVISTNIIRGRLLGKIIILNHVTGLKIENPSYSCVTKKLSS